MKTYAIRLKPGEDLKMRLDEVAENWSAACILTAVGSLTKVSIRYANCDAVEELNGHFEIVSLVGTLGSCGSHLHLSISDREGNTIGGHLKEGSTIYTTAEIVIGILDEWTFSREPDATTGYPELVIKENR